uniref:Single domain-containing protein n=1 Tax=Amblyomma triste TaxID=251400 RepID=A0A023G844_AMBTT
MRLSIFAAAMNLLFIKYLSVCGQSVTKYQVNVTDSGKCHFNGTEYPEGENTTATPCMLTYCDPNGGELTVVKCSDTTPPPSCVTLPPGRGEYPSCCSGYLC